ncbi:hypothetical protein SDC9_190966 [bioreactor metagenome]|uniref:Uncharacterized protein n=1 Tax=bioreactor metagenome TaxID=1076179 RepID=A0A645HWN0_9ZZZZ
MMGHEAFDDDLSRRLETYPLGSIVRRFVIAVGAFQTLRFQISHVFKRRFRAHHKSHKGRIGRRHRVLHQAPFKAQPGYPDGLVLVIKVDIQGMEGGLRYAPGHIAHFSVFLLALHDK